MLLAAGGGMHTQPYAAYRHYFADRRDAGRLLSRALARYADADPVILALPRGGVPVAYEIARALALPLDLLLVAKIGAPNMPDLAIGAVGALEASAGGGFPQRVLNPSIIEAMDLPAWYVDSEAKNCLRAIADSRRRYARQRMPRSLQGRTAIIVDDCVATGATARAALHASWVAGAAKRILAVPVAPYSLVKTLAAEADEFVCLLSPTDFRATRFYFGEFDRVKDEEVAALLAA